MNETLKRAISGAVYITLLIASILYSNETFFILFGIFLLIAVYEYCALVHLKQIISILFAFLLYGAVTLICFYKKDVQSFLLNTTHKHYQLDVDITLLYQILLGITIITSLKCIHFLFSDRIGRSASWKYSTPIRERLHPLTRKEALKRFTDWDRDRDCDRDRDRDC